MNMLGRLKKRPEFLHVQKNAKKWTSTSLVLQIAPNNAEISRFGLTVTKKTYKEAVKRNRIRRRLRTLAYEILPLHAASGYDFVLIGRTETLEAPYETLVKDLKWCLKRLEILTQHSTDIILK